VCEAHAIARWDKSQTRTRAMWVETERRAVTNALAHMLAVLVWLT